MNRSSASIQKSAVAGFSLIEMLVTVLILSIGLLGLAGLQATGLRNNMSAYQRTQASVLATDILDRMRANRAVALAGTYDIAFTDNSSSTGAALVDADINQWLGCPANDPSPPSGCPANEPSPPVGLSTELPEGDGSIDCTTANPVCVVTVRWNDNRGASGNAASYQSFIVSAEL